MTRILTLVFLLTLLAACSFGGIGEPRVTLSTATPVPPAIRGGTAAPTRVASATPAATATSALANPTAVPATPDTPPAEATLTPLPDSALFEGVTWEARAPFEAHLVNGEFAELARELPGSVYHLDLTIAPDYRSMTGLEEVYYTNREEVPLDEILFRLYPNLLGGSSSVRDVRVNGKPMTPVLEIEETALRVPLPAPLAPGESVVIAMEFEVTIPDNPEGNYGSFTFVDQTLALAHAYPIVAEYSADEGGWEAEIPAQSGDIIYAASSFYRVRLTTPAAAVVAASGTQISAQENGDTRTAVYEAGPVRDFYITMSENYIVAEGMAGDTLVRSYSYSNPDIGADVLEETIASVEIFNTLIGPYPFRELEIAETPNLALGIEYPGVIVLTNRLYDPMAQSGGNLAAVRESTVAHEVGHQWFYSTVGNDQLDEPWLDESLAQYVTYRYFVARDGEQAAQGFLASLEGRWESISQRPIPVGLPVQDYTGQEYGAIIYGRGPLFLITLEQELGTETIDRFLQSYYAQNRFGVATTETLKAALEGACACDMTPRFDEWIYSE